MKYAKPENAIPFSKRKIINDKILHIVQTGGHESITKQDIYQSYTGDGGLHGLDFKDFNSHSAFSKAKKEIENGQFFTPHDLCKSIVDSLFIQHRDIVADLSCGSGAFFNFLPEESNVYGCEIDAKAYSVAKYLYPEANIVNQDFRLYKAPMNFDFVIGNPPFNIDLQFEKLRTKSHQVFIEQSKRFLKPGGVLAIVLPASYLADDHYYRWDIENIQDNFSCIAEVKLSPKAFAHLGVQHFATKTLYFQKKGEGVQMIAYQDRNVFDSFSDVNFVALMQTIKNQRELYFNKNSLVLKQHSESDLFIYKIRKYFYEFKRQKALKKKLNHVTEYYNEFINQVKPEDMSYEKWIETRITEDDVIKFFARTMRNAYCVKREADTFKMNKYGVTISPTVSDKESFSELEQEKVSYKKYELLDNLDLIRKHPLGSKVKSYIKNLELIKAKFDSQMEPIDEENSLVDSYFKNFTFINSSDEEVAFTDLQAKAAQLSFNKPFGIHLNIEQGGGKTGIAYSVVKRRIEESLSKRVFIIGPPIAIRNTWSKFLTRQGDTFVMIDSLEDFEKILSTKYVLIPSTKVVEYARFLRKIVKINIRKSALIFDESDEISNVNAGRSKAITSVFKSVPYKLLATGTATRNNISEFYGQLQLLYNNSYAMMNRCAIVYKQDTGEEKKIVSFNNRFLNKPFSAYHGYSSFRSCFNPTKSTVFGINKVDQNIYNADELKKILNYTIYTKTLEDITGREMHVIKNHFVDFSPSEECLYEQIVDNVQSQIPLFFENTGNARKESALKIIRQISLMLRACSMPESMSSTIERSSKMENIIDFINELPGYVMLGCLTKQAAHAYRDALQEQYPSRQVFLITGSSKSFAARNRIIDEFKASKNGILVSTQQSLSCSLDIEFCDDVIIESQAWNNPRMAQYYARAVRFNSDRKTRIHFFLYRNSIEVNLAALVTDKECLNSFMKERETKTRLELMTTRNMDLTMLDMLLTRVYDKFGKSKLTWGKQQITS